MYLWVFDAMPYITVRYHDFCEAVKESHVIKDHIEVPYDNPWDEQQHLGDSGYTLKTGQHDCHFAFNILKLIFLYENRCIFYSNCTEICSLGSN